MRGNIIAQWRVASSSGHGDYVVSKYSDGDYSCGCKGWTMHTPRRDCKHIALVRAGLAPDYDPLLAAMVIAKNKEERRLARLARPTGRPVERKHEEIATIPPGSI